MRTSGTITGMGRETERVEYENEDEHDWACGGEEPLEGEAASCIFSS